MHLLKQSLPLLHHVSQTDTFWEVGKLDETALLVTGFLGPFLSHLLGSFSVSSTPGFHLSTGMLLPCIKATSLVLLSIYE